MIYFEAKNDIEEVKKFRKWVREFWGIEEEFSKHRRRKRNYEDLSDDDIKRFERLQELRKNIAKSTPKMIRLANQNEVAANLKSYPAPAVGGPVVPVNIFRAILNDDSHSGVENQRILDTINTLIGQLEERRDREFKNLINPFYWLGLLIEKILRTPFWLLSKTGFNVDKIEDHFWGKFFKVIEVVVILYISIRLGISDEILSELLTLIK